MAPANSEAVLQVLVPFRRTDQRFLSDGANGAVLESLALAMHQHASGRPTGEYVNRDLATILLPACVYGRVELQNAREVGAPQHILLIHTPFQQIHRTAVERATLYDERVSRASIAALLIAGGSVVSSLVAFLFGARTLARWAVLPASIVAVWAFIGHLVTMTTTRRADGQIRMLRARSGQTRSANSS